MTANIIAFGVVEFELLAVIILLAMVYGFPSPFGVVEFELAKVLAS